MKARLKKLALWLAQLLGREFHDERTGKSLGRVFVLPAGKQTFIVGLPHALRPIFLPEITTRYTRHRLGFATHEEPDYPALQGGQERTSPERLLWAILVHQSSTEIKPLLCYWESLGYSAAQMLFVHAGRKEDFEKLDLPNKIFVADSDIRTTFHPMEKQSYGGALREIAAWLCTEKGGFYDAVALVEYDHIPLISDWASRLCDLMEREQADLLCHHLVRVDGTNSSHYLYHLSDPRFAYLWRGISRREEKSVCLNAIMTGSVWRKEALKAVAARRESSPVYLELYLPSLAHHLGYRVRRYGVQDQFVEVIPMKNPFSSDWKERGAWSLHQVKDISSFFKK